jgi:hypothetical protein
MSAITRDPVHALEVPTDSLPLLLPSACMAEVWRCRAWRVSALNAVVVGRARLAVAAVQ